MGVDGIGGKGSSRELRERAMGTAGLEAGERLLADALVDFAVEGSLPSAFAPAADESKGGDEGNSDENTAGGNGVVDGVGVFRGELGGTGGGVDRARCVSDRGRS